MTVIQNGVDEVAANASVITNQGCAVGGFSPAANTEGNMSSVINY